MVLSLTTRWKWGKGGGQLQASTGLTLLKEPHWIGETLLLLGIQHRASSLLSSHYTILVI